MKRVQTPGYRLFTSGFTNSRTDSMNICATGLSDRFFKVVMPTGCRMSGSLTGSALSPGCLRGRRSEKLTTTVRKRSVASSSFRRMMEVASTVSRGGSRPAIRNTPACCAEISVGRIQHPRLAQQLGKLDLAAASQWIVRSSDHDQSIMEKNFFRILLADRTRES